jgi:hypothetical protein
MTDISAASAAQAVASDASATYAALVSCRIDDQGERRASLQRFIAHTYAASFGARVGHFAEHLVGIASPTGEWRAAVGYTLARAPSLFLERYLDAPVEQVLGRVLGVAIAREQIVEVGNFAACTPGAARHVIVRMTALLQQLRLGWVVFTATRSLLNSFVRLRIEPIHLAHADPARLPDGGASWGCYYATRPAVMAASIPLGAISLGLGADRRAVTPAPRNAS